MGERVSQRTMNQYKPVFITQNSVMKDLLNKIKLVAKTKASLLITGENGTGKEVLAGLAHYYSSRSDNEMITINCDAIPEDLVTSQLLGYEKDAFTGATERKEGGFDLANKSTLFLDEIGEMPKQAQVQLLRAVELQSFRRIGGKKEIKFDINIISSTNKTLIDQVKLGSFLKDLFYRLNMIELYVPPLRNRREDIPLLVTYFKNHFVDTNQLEPVEISDECMGIFKTYDWPGNVQQLKNIVERCIVLCQGNEIEVDTIPAHIHSHSKDKIFSIYPDSKFYKDIQIPVNRSGIL